MRMKARMVRVCNCFANGAFERTSFSALVPSTDENVPQILRCSNQNTMVKGDTYKVQSNLTNFDPDLGNINLPLNPRQRIWASCMIRAYFNSGPNAEEALIHKLEGGDATETTPPANKHDSIGAMAGQVRDKDGGGGDIRQLAAKAKTKVRRKKAAQNDTQQPGKLLAEGVKAKWLVYQIPMAC